ncbi:NACHT domain-containing protein [Streptomyces sp. NPDC015144]|uniref:NACHT domain-containing protein n=1 Tax=Streptomyces sp. NPDC015144 TaxID=3364944 RepID=UPI0036F991ED
MSGLEVALLRLATTVASTVARSLLTKKPGAGLVPDPVRPLPRPAEPDRLARVLGDRLAATYADLPEHERLAAVDAVRDAFAAAGGPTPERLFAVDLDPQRLAAELPPPDAGLSERAAGLYGELLVRCCAHLVEQLTAEPSFLARAAVEQTRSVARTRDLVADVRDRVGPRPDAAALEFEHRYARFMATSHGRMGLFGLTLGRTAAEWPLETAYISLTVSTNAVRHHDGLDHPAAVAVSVEQALAGSDRLLLRGPAGSGKSTLVQWLAVNAARRTFGPALAEWNRCVPFVLRLRAFTSDDPLPAPDDFLRASGVPLHGAAPAGWADRLLTEGRALVLVDGVDEVPMRQRRRTEKWLKDLITAYPNARYVVTTRPSAVPEGWLSGPGPGFAPHVLLPMGREDIRLFVEHWHRAARTECADPLERERLDAYEASLRRAVGTRRDLARLATNPLMCALLCALNRDRRTQLPRARKELYDAALDMLLVRRDTERDILGVEGVDLTREEQTALLQRLAYWLIRNGQAEADRAEAQEMVGEWLTAMPQVRGGAEEVFAHLLIRSGLLREPAPGAVGFVHRTFQDYLGARAAVEARDFGVLVKHGHDDQWHDVVQMAVGHARADERAKLLRQLLKRAARTKEHGSRLVLLAAAALDHAPELDPAVRAEVRERTAELLPPRTHEEAEALAEVGELVLGLLPEPQEVAGEYAAGYVVRTAALVGGEAAFEVIKGYRNDGRDWVAAQLSEAWGAFDTDDYAREVLAAQKWNAVPLAVANDRQLAALRHVDRAGSIRLHGDRPDLSDLVTRHDLERLIVLDNEALTDLSPLASMRSLTEVLLSRCPEVRDLSPLSDLALTWLSLVELHPDLPKDHLESITGLHGLNLSHRFPVDSLSELPLGPRLRTMVLGRQVGNLGLEGIEQCSELNVLGLQDLRHVRYMHRNPFFQRLTRLDLSGMALPALSALADLTGLQKLVLTHCLLTEGLAHLRELPALTHLTLYAHWNDGPADLTPLADRDSLTITLGKETEVIGAELFPPERLVRLG